ncbi:MAG TPA: phosphoribosylamine--glycine ligase [Anaerolineae bacterium]|jgi:phosphoribosylamine--glycine ligase
MAHLNVLVIGSGGREHALVWALARSPQIGGLYVAPGNAGTERDGCHNVAISSEDIPALIQFARDSHIGLTVVGPEAPLANGIVDQFQAQGLRVFGPRQQAAQLESSKAFAKQFFMDYGIPTAHYARFDAYEPAVEWVRLYNRPMVVKADGLAAGKGVIICEDVEDAEIALHRAMLDDEFGAAGRTVIIEERLSGPELSVLAFCDGRSVLLMPTARDHKRVFDNDAGPNTGGMGAYAPVPGITTQLIDDIRRSVIQPAVDGMAARGTPYIGVLYAGMMLTADGPRTLEFNCRFGDPETQVILPLLKSDLLEIMLACTERKLAEVAPSVQWHTGACAAVVLASGGYPGHYLKGIPIEGLAQSDQRPGVKVFHAGTVMHGPRVVTAGGRVVAVSAVDADLPAALKRAYAAVNDIHFEHMHYRTDIGKLPS